MNQYPISIRRWLVAIVASLVIAASAMSVASGAAAQSPVPIEGTPDLALIDASVIHVADLGILVFSQTVEGTVGATVPEPAGQLDGAPVLAHVFPTTLSPTAVGFSEVEGILALVVTSHPDFDDTPLWDENVDGNYDNDGVVYHTHWVVLGQDDRVPGGLAVIEFHSNGEAAVLPPTAPGMPMYMDSPGFAVRLDGSTMQVVVPVDRVGNQTEFNFDAVTCYLEVNTTDMERPMLGVYAVYAVLSGDLSLPYSVSDDTTA
ncbi:MAG: hypothetical protein KF883_02380 [Thermomicrobiales bacterium]|nr:hypothetical protein [Thermomicrobiales bacterium]